MAIGTVITLRYLILEEDDGLSTLLSKRQPRRAYYLSQVTRVELSGEQPSALVGRSELSFEDNRLRYTSDGILGLPRELILIGDRIWRRDTEEWLLKSEDPLARLLQNDIREWRNPPSFGYASAGSGPAVAGEETLLFRRVDRRLGPAAQTALARLATPDAIGFNLNASEIATLTSRYAGVTAQYEIVIGQSSGEVYVMRTVIQGPQMMTEITTTLVDGPRPTILPPF